MNVLALLDDEIKDKNWDVELKKRYLYLRSCELFSYDPRYYWCNYFLSDRLERMEKLRNRKIDLEDLEDSWVICTTYAKEVFAKLVEELLNVECELLGSGHVYAVMKDNPKLKIVADASYGNDFTRVKMGLSTYGYYPVNKNGYKFKQELKVKDKTLEYVNGEYLNSTLKEYASTLFDEFLESTTDWSEDAFLVYRIEKVKEWVDIYNPLVSDFSDLRHCLSYLQTLFLDDDCNKVLEVSLFDQSSDNDWTFVNIYPVELENDMLYYAILPDKNSCYSLQKITKTDAVHYVNNLRGNNKKLIYHK